MQRLQMCGICTISGFRLPWTNSGGLTLTNGSLRLKFRETIYPLTTFSTRGGDSDIDLLGVVDLFLTLNENKNPSSRITSQWNCAPPQPISPPNLKRSLPAAPMLRIRPSTRRRSCHPRAARRRTRIQSFRNRARPRRSTTTAWTSSSSSSSLVGKNLNTAPIKKGVVGSAWQPSLNKTFGVKSPPTPPEGKGVTRLRRTTNVFLSICVKLPSFPYMSFTTVRRLPGSHLPE